ncbi:Vsp/OspC family lipoprotein [Borrelia crocidurae]|uniref:Lipoprotein-containing protein n=1 Tax=Borrelia crocidurae (strain Achema) TaxID=1155096 RepID=I0FF10_BORCA|nr:Vsp/OspC family lipoprotein [Borrelia crocidurae]AFI32066.1 Lipoprotein-containing protein [Borrelia crocidurae str. Achema]
MKREEKKGRREIERENRGDIMGVRRGNRIIKGIMVMVVMVVMGYNSGGGIKEGEEGKARKGDGSVIDLKVVSKKIRDAVEFIIGIEEVQTLINSVDELAKAIGKKIKNDGTLEAESANADKNSQLVAGAFSVILEMGKRVTAY